MLCVRNKMLIKRDRIQTVLMWATVKQAIAMQCSKRYTREMQRALGTQKGGPNG